MIIISVNGEPQQIALASTLASLVEQLGLTGKRIAVERNGDIVPRSQFATLQLVEGDKLELVTAVGGG